MMLVLDGKLLYLKMVKGERDNTYLKLKERFDRLLGGKDLSMIIEIWENNGIEAAMNKFYEK